MIIRFCAVIYFGFFYNFLFSQEIGTINTDRPDQSDGTYTLPVGYVQLENGVFMAENAILNNMMIRYSILPGTELRLLMDVGKISDKSGLLPITLSAKQKIISQSKLIPAVTMVGYARYGKLATSEFRTNEITYNLLLAIHYDLTHRAAASFNIGTTWVPNELNYTTIVSYKTSSRTLIYVEYFSNIKNMVNPRHHLDMGLLFWVNDRFQLDIAPGISVRNDSMKYITMGLSYRIRT